MVKANDNKLEPQFWFKLFSVCLNLNTVLVMNKNLHRCNKKNLADFLDVSVRSIDRYTSLGMPCIHAEEIGKEKVYIVAYAIHLFVGYMESKPYKLRETDGLVLTLFGYAVGGLNGFQLQNKGAEIATITGHSEFDIGRAVGILKQGNLVRI